MWLNGKALGFYVEPNDWDVLLGALRAGTDAGKTYRQIMNSLHEKNTHSSCHWKDIFLEYHDQALEAVKAREVSIAASSSQHIHQSSRSPPPPKKVVSASRRGGCMRGKYQFTPEDVSYITALAKYLHEKERKTISLRELCDKLAEKAPHHSSHAWYRQIKRYKAVRSSCEKACGITIDGEAGGQHGESSERGSAYRPRRDRMCDDLVSDEYQTSGGELDVADNIDRPGDAESDAMQLRETGAPDSGPEWRTLARFIASSPEWSRSYLSENMERFHNKYQNRTVDVWTRYYRVNQQEINLLARRFKREWKRKWNSMVNVDEEDSKAGILIKAEVTEESQHNARLLTEMSHDSPGPSYSGLEGSTSYTISATPQYRLDEDQSTLVNGDGEAEDSSEETADWEAVIQCLNAEDRDGDSDRDAATANGLSETERLDWQSSPTTLALSELEVGAQPSPQSMLANCYVESPFHKRRRRCDDGCEEPQSDTEVSSKCARLL